MYFILSFLKYQRMRCNMTRLKAISLLENSSKDINNLKKELHEISRVSKTCSIAGTSQSNRVDNKTSFSARTSLSTVYAQKPNV